MKSFIITGAAYTIILLCAGTSTIHSASITLTANDTTGESSFNSAGHWSDGLAPSAGKDYELVAAPSSSYTLRTPASIGNYTFAGSSLTLNVNSHIAYKGSGSTDTITVNNLYMNAGSYINNYSANSFILAGSITLLGNGTFQFSTNNGGFNISSIISGSGRLNFSTLSAQTTLASFAASLNSTNFHTGGTYIGKNAYVNGNATNAFGMGNVNVTGGLLKLSVADAIDDSAGLIISSGLTDTTLALYYSGTMTISSLSLNGGSSYLASGTYSISDLNSLYGFSIFIGDGITDSALIQVIPEPSTVLTFAFGLLCVGLLVGAKKNQRTVSL